MLFILKSEEETQLVVRLYEKYKNLMFKVAHDILNDQSLAEDAVHMSFVKIIKNIHKIDEEKECSTRNFMAIICRNMAINLYNKRRKINENSTVEADRELEDTKYDPSKIVIDNDSAQLIYQAVSELPDIYLDVLVLKIAYQYTREEIAGILDIQPNNVKKRLAVARSKIAQALEKEGLI